MRARRGDGALQEAELSRRSGGIGREVYPRYMPPDEQSPGVGSPYREGGAAPPVEPRPRDAAVRWSTLLVLALAGILLWIGGVALREHRLAAARAALPRGVQQETFPPIADAPLPVCP